jgi:hypothetical protein
VSDLPFVGRVSWLRSRFMHFDVHREPYLDPALGASDQSGTAVGRVRDDFGVTGSVEGVDELS